MCQPNLALCFQTDWRRVFPFSQAVKNMASIDSSEVERCSSAGSSPLWKSLLDVVIGGSDPELSGELCWRLWAIICGFTPKITKLCLISSHPHNKREPWNISWAFGLMPATGPKHLQLVAWLGWIWRNWGPGPETMLALGFGFGTGSLWAVGTQLVARLVLHKIQTIARWAQVKVSLSWIQLTELELLSVGLWAEGRRWAVNRFAGLFSRQQRMAENPCSSSERPVQSTSVATAATLSRQDSR